MINEINRKRFTNNYLIGFIGGIHAPLVIKWQGELNPDFIALLLMCASMIKITQTLFSKMSPKYSLWLPLVVDAVMLLLLPIVYYSVTMTINVSVLGGSLILVLYINRSSYVSEVLKNHYNIRNINNKIISCCQVGSIFGSLVVFCYLQFLPSDQFPTTHLYVISGMIVISIIMYKNIKLNVLIKKIVDSDENLCKNNNKV